jgi:hypothetical protein
VEENEKWRVEFDDVNTKKVLEIHNALKLLNNNIGKVGSDSKDRYGMISDEIKVLENAVTM